MIETGVKGRIQGLAKTMDWRDKKILYFVSNTEQATLFLEHVELKNTHIRLVRDKELSMFCSFLFVGKKTYPVKQINSSDFLWADEIVLMVGKNASEKFLEKYAGDYDEEKIRMYDTPYESLQKIYLNAENIPFKVLDKIELDTKHEILENDIPFIEEPLLGELNKRHEGSYVTYSMGRKDLTRGMYFDEEEISDIKKYGQFNKGTIVVVFGKKTEENNFTEESMLVYGAVYGSSNVVYLENPADFIIENEKDYIFINASVRMISPFFTKYFKTMREKAAKQDLIGLVSPKRIYDPEDIKIMWGNKKAFTLWQKNSPRFIEKSYWYQYVMNACIVAEDSMFNRMDFQNVYVDCRDKEKTIGYTEWMINRMDICGGGSGINL